MASYCNRTYRPLGRMLRGPSLALAVVYLAGCNQSTSPPVELAFGQEPYLRYCASCHGNQGLGKPPTFPPLANSEWLDLGSEALGLIVLYGLRGEIEVAGRTYRGYMPPMQHISDDDIAALLTYVDDAWAGGQQPISAQDITRLRTLFEGPKSPLDGLEGLREAMDAL